MGEGKRFVRFNRGPKDTSCSDLLACLPPEGRFAGVEVKKPGGKLTERQRAFLHCVVACGGVGIVVHSLDELIAALKAEGVAT